MEERLRKAEEAKRRGEDEENSGGGGLSIGGALGGMKSKIGSVTNAIT